MANPALAARQRAQAIWPGAVVHSRGRKWIRHQDPGDPSRFIVDYHIAAIHYGAGVDQEIDTAWNPTTGAWDWKMTQAGYQAHARDTFNVGGLFEFHSDGEWVRFDPQSINWIDESLSRQQIAIKQAVTAQADDATLSFPNAYGSGRHFKYLNGTTRLTKLITIDALSDLPDPEPYLSGEVWFEAEFSLGISSGLDFYLDGVLWERRNGIRVRTGNQIEVRDAATGSQVLWWLGYPSAQDSNPLNENHRTIGEMEVRRQGGPSSLFVCVRIPKSWIDAATFPIYIDPTIDKDIASENDDGTARSGNSSIDDTSILVGYHTNPSIKYRDWWLRYTGISGLSGASITTSYIYLDVVTPNTNLAKLIRAEDAAAPLAPTNYADFIGKTLTSAGVTFTGMGGDGNSPSLNTVIQELADTYDPSAIQLITIDDGQSTSSTELEGYADYGTSVYTPLHIEYTTGAAGDSIPYLAAHAQRRQQHMIVR